MALEVRFAYHYIAAVADNLESYAAAFAVEMLYQCVADTVLAVLAVLLR